MTHHITTTQFVTSADGTRLAVTKEGAGPALVLVEGAMCYRAAGSLNAVAALLKDRFTCITYDRRGRGESGNVLPFSPERELEDLDAVIAVAEGPVALMGLSSGAAIALEMANRSASVSRLITYEAPFVTDDTISSLPKDFRQRIEQAVSEGREGDALKIFMSRVGVPGFALFIMQFMPMWKRLKSIAGTLSYDLQFVETHSNGVPLPKDAWPNIAVPTLCLDGDKSPPYMRNSQRAIAGTIPTARYASLADQTHMVKADVLAQAIASFLEEQK